MNVKLAHPRRKRLAAWLESGGRDESVTSHVEHCERCAALLEEMSEAEGHPELVPDDELGEAIRDALSPPDDLEERVLRGIAERERTQREAALFFGLISLPKDAAELMMPPEATSTDPPTERPAIDAAGGDVGPERDHQPNQREDPDMNEDEDR